MRTELARAVRRMFRQPLVAFMSVASLSLAFATNLAAFNILNALVWREVPVSNPGRLVQIATASPSGAANGLTFRQFELIRQGTSPFSSVIAWYGDRLSNVEINGHFLRANNWFVTGDFYSSLGTQPSMGRLLTTSDMDLDQLRAEPVAVIGYSFWKKVWGEDTNVVGTVLRVEGVPFTIVGVTPPGFTGFSVTTEPDVTLPLTARPLLDGRPPQQLRESAAFAVTVLAWLKHNVQIGQAKAELESRWPEILQSSIPASLPPSQRDAFLANFVTVTSAATGIERFVRQRFTVGLQTLLGLSFLVLVIGSANLAGVMLSRTASRIGEFALLAAIGANRRRISLNVVAEALVLVGAASTVGLLLAYWMVRALLAYMFSDFLNPISLDLSFDPSVWAYLILIASTTSAILVSASLWWLRPSRYMTALAQQTSRSLPSTHRLGSTLATVQVALAIAVVSIGALLVRSLLAVQSIPLGYSMDNVSVIQTYPRPGGYRGLNDDTYDNQLVSSLSRIATVDEVAISSLNPSGGNASVQPVQVIGQGAEIQAAFSSVSPGFFNLLQIPFRRGRDIAWSDTTRTSRVAVLSENLASRLFGSESPLGRRIRIGTQSSRQNIEIVGVVADTRLYDPRRPDTAAVYVSHVQEGELGRWKTLVIRSDASLASFQADVRAAVDGLGREYVLYSRTLAHQASLVTKEESVTGGLAAFFGAMTLLIAGLGVFGLLAFSVALRTREIGLRMALGATPRLVLSLIVWQAVRVCTIGVAGGLAAAFVSHRFVRSLLFGVTPNDLFSQVAAVALMLAVALTAAAVPAARALRADPIATLR